MEDSPSWHGSLKGKNDLIEALKQLGASENEIEAYLK